ncbi:DNA polymerase III subunit psi [Psychrobacter jeotgali]|uniref:DNA polymerase III subunit psi n=1 Tax=Psychrobacter jeotgali TaxID=179010 RepID=UPI00191B4FA4|nr:DNA polymerase III subunit psi [Psychrobacter jeotgali]
MSDTQDLLLRQHKKQQRQIQQRQILAMMGIGQWVQPNSPTLAIDEISASIEQALTAQQPTSYQPVDSEPELKDINNQALINNEENSSQFEDAPVDVEDAEVDSVDIASVSIATPANVEQAVEPLLDKVSNKVTAPVINESLEEGADEQDNVSFDKVAPFDLQGARYGDWIVMVDIQALNNDSQKLWQNITQALSLTCETTSFPICVGMDTAELANASLAGYLFKIGRSEDIKVAALTELPEGLTHPNIAQVPSLDEMLADSALKRDLWQQISQ